MEMDKIADIQKELRRFKEVGPSRTSNLLSYIKKSNLTTEQIKITKISQTVTSISKCDLNDEASKKYDSEELKNMISIAQDLISGWKKLFASKSSNSNNNNKKGSPTQSKKRILKPEEIDTSVFQNDLNPEIRNKAVERTYRNLMCTQGISSAELVPEKILQLILDFEGRIWRRSQIASTKQIAEKDYSKDMTKVIKTTITNQTFNICTIKGIYTVDQIGKMEEEIFKSEEQKAKDRKIKEDYVASQDPEFFNKKKLEFQKTACEAEECPKCGGKKAYCQQEIQIRGADEPMTRFMRCDECDHDWTD